MFRHRFILLSALFYMAGCGFEAVPKHGYESKNDTVGVIYGEDSIKSVVLSIPNSKNSVAFIPKDAFAKFLKKEPVEIVEDKIGLVESLDWLSEPALAHCSGVLIKKDLVLTAGHCFEGIGSCENFNVVFGYEQTPAILESMTAIGCKEVIEFKNELEKGLDYALVRLEKETRFPVATVSSHDSAVGDDVYTLGYPLGSPKKKADGKIRQIITESGLYNSTLDVFEGNSGSPVYSSKTHELIGIVSSGETDFEDESENEQGMKVKHCSEDECLGEIIVPIQKILADIAK